MKEEIGRFIVRKDKNDINIQCPVKIFINNS